VKPHKFFYKLLDILTVLCLLIFFASFGFQDSKSGGWYQQWFPNMNGSTIASLTFLDSLTGYAATGTSSTNQCYILKTTNSGDNWNIIYTYNSGANIHFTKIQFANSSIGYASTNYFDFFKTTNGGVNWILLSTPWGGDDMAVINSDTILLADYAAIMGGIYRSTNGGSNWQLIWAEGGTNQNPYTIYMYNKDIGFNLGVQGMKKTTNGGVNWFAIAGESYSGIQFYDSLTGWKSYDSIKKTTNGGINWVTQIAPKISNEFGNSCISILNKDTIWLVGATYFGRPPVYKTTNGGINWGYQFPDTTLQLYFFGYISFVNKKNGWVNPASPTSEMHTATGGNDTTIYTNIKEQITNISEKYKLYQNYPNPFNQCTIINVQLQIAKHVKINIYDITGKLINTIINQKENSGLHSYKFDGGNLSTGVYFYTLFVDGNRVDTKKAVLIK
jgi:photosystem II stability/assembly factor-like uncharacterized protein